MQDPEDKKKECSWTFEEFISLDLDADDPWITLGYDPEDFDDEGGETSSKYLEFTDQKSQKFWEITLDGDAFTVRFGKIGTTGQLQTKEFEDADQALKEYRKLVAEKQRKATKRSRPEGNLGSPQNCPSMQQHSAICPLCEATCGLTITLDGEKIEGIRGNPEDLFSKGYICPKGYALKALNEDPDRLRTPRIRSGESWREATWEEAFALIEERLPPLIKSGGADSIAVYLGNPNVHNLAGQLYVPALLRALGSRSLFSASTLDQMPKHLSSGLMFGDPLSIPIPDVDRTDYLLILGANPLVSNGSLMTAPNMKGRLKALKARGGKLVVVDPRRTLTAQEADEHLFIRPGQDALFLMAVVHTLWSEGLVNPGAMVEHLSDLEGLRELSNDFSPEAVAPLCAIESQTIRRIARELAAAPTAVVYGRLGTCTQSFGSMCSWLVDVLNTLTGNLDRAGGAMFTKGAAGARNTSGTPGRGRGFRLGAYHSRVRKVAGLMGELPTAVLAEEILTPGQGQIRGLITIAGNPALSAPNSGHLEKALTDLDFMISVDCYLNETTRHAHVILPPPAHLQRGHYDLTFSQLAVRNMARYAAPLLKRELQQPDEWETLLKLSAIVAGYGAATPVKTVDDLVASQLVEREIKQPDSPIADRSVGEILKLLAPRRGPERLLDLLLRVGPYGDAFGKKPEGLTLAAVEAAPQGIDLGPLQPRIPEVLRTPSGKVEMAPPLLVADVERLRASLIQKPPALVLIGRRALRSNNSWMHNLPLLTKGRSECTLLIHPQDAHQFGLAEGELARVTSDSGSLEVEVEISATMMPGVVSLPHGWGHSQPQTEMASARRRPGVNVNLLLGDTELEPLTGNAIQNAVPITVCPV